MGISTHCSIAKTNYVFKAADLFYNVGVFLIPVTPSKFLYEWLVFIVLHSQETTASRHWQKAREHFPGVLQSKVCGAGVSRSRSSCSSTFGCLDRSAVLGVSAGLG